MSHASLQSYNDIIQLIHIPDEGFVEKRNCVEIITAKSNVGSAGVASVGYVGGKLIELTEEDRDNIAGKI